MLKKVLIFKKSIIFSPQKLRILNKSTIFVSTKGVKIWQTKGNIKLVARLAVGVFGKLQQVRRFRASAGTESQHWRSGTS